MPATPQITLTATLDDLAGAAAGSTANAAKLRIALCGFDSVLPRIVGTAMLARVGPMDFLSTGSAISTPIWGNDVITPSGTFYSIEILDGQDNVVQCDAYQLIGSGTQDLSSLTPITPRPPPPATDYQFIGSACGAISIDLSKWSGPTTIDMTLTCNVTITVTGGTKGQTVQWIIRQNGTGGYTVSWGANVINPALVNTDASSVSTQSMIVDYLAQLYPQNGWS